MTDWSGNGATFWTRTSAIPLYGFSLLTTEGTPESARIFTFTPLRTADPASSSAGPQITGNPSLPGRHKANPDISYATFPAYR